MSGVAVVEHVGLRSSVSAVTALQGATWLLRNPQPRGPLSKSLWVGGGGGKDEEERGPPPVATEA